MNCLYQIKYENPDGSQYVHECIIDDGLDAVGLHIDYFLRKNEGVIVLQVACIQELPEKRR